MIDDIYDWMCLIHEFPFIECIEKLPLTTMILLLMNAVSIWTIKFFKLHIILKMRVNKIKINQIKDVEKGNNTKIIWQKKLE